MSAITPAPEPPSSEEGLDYPRGLVPPTQRGRSQRQIGDIIVDLGFARREAVENAVIAAREQKKPVGQLLIERGELRRDQLARALAERFGVDFIDLSVFDIDMGAVSMVEADAAKRYQAVPVGFLDDALLLAMADPANVITVDEMAMITGRKVRPVAAAPEDIAALIGRINRREGPVLAELEEDPNESEITAISEPPENDGPVIKLVQSIIAEAVQRGASDIHWNPEAGDMQVLVRIDGVLTPVATVARSMAAAAISRVKIMANLDISERRVPQDGRLAATVDGRRVDVRVVTLPLIKGEGIVMRILDMGAVVRDLDSLRMSDRDRDRFVAAITRPYGAVLVTGPTGSGKSTTLYGALGFINNGERSILTIEDPVESQIPGVRQMQVAVKRGVTFANGLRSMLRADPDVIMVGEIRDPETAEIAIQAALTGHLVLSTLHTRDAPSALARLTDMGVEPFMVAAAIDCVVAQRLARTLCTHCKRHAHLSDAVRDEHGLQGAEVFEPAGCIRCGGTGYEGRVGLYEVMPLTEEIRALALERRGAGAIAAVAREQGMRTMREDGIDKVRQGLTSLVEVGRVTSAA
jgi:type IV pilus assembly protein PilB